MKYLIITLALLSGTAATAGEFELDVYGRSYVHSCGYYSNESADLSVNFTGRSLPWGTRVFIVYGWAGHDTTSSSTNHPFEWVEKGEEEAQAVAPYQWRFNVSKTLHTRSSARFLRAFQFGIRVEAPNKGPQYFPRMAWSFYQAPIGNNGNSPCTDGTIPPPSMTRIQQMIIERK